MTKKKYLRYLRKNSGHIAIVLVLLLVSIFVIQAYIHKNTFEPVQIVIQQKGIDVYYGYSKYYIYDEQKNAYLIRTSADNRHEVLRDFENLKIGEKCYLECTEEYKTGIRECKIVD